MSDDTVVHNYGPEFQKQVLKLMLLDYKFGFKACAYLREDFFTGELRWFFSKIRDFYDQFKHAPNAMVLGQMVLRHGDSAPVYEAIRQEIEALDILPTKDYIKREITGFIRANVFVGAYKHAASLYNTGSKEDAYKFTTQKLKELQEVDFERERYSTFEDHTHVLELARTHKTNSIRTGIIAIDTAMGGLAPQTWTTFIGASSSGKSMICPNLAFMAAEDNYKTFVTIHEDEEIPTKLRYLSRFSLIPINKLIQPQNYWTQEDREAYEIAVVKLNKFVRLRFMYGTESFIENVADAARLMKHEWDFNLFLCDYGQCLKSRAYRSMDDKYGVQEHIYQELKQTCLELNVAGAGGAQTNRLGHKVNKSGADFLRMTDVGESWGICKKSSNVITMNRSDSDIKNNRITFLLDKCRNGRSPVAVQCVSYYEACMTHIPSSSHQVEINVDGRNEEEAAQ